MRAPGLFGGYSGFEIVDYASGNVPSVADGAFLDAGVSVGHLDVCSFAWLFLC